MRPLEEVKILDFTHVLAGPFGSRVLADMGADVVKIMSTVRETGRAPAGLALLHHVEPQQAFARP